MKERNIKASEIAKILNVDFIGHDVIINGLNLCNRESLSDSIISFITSTKFILNIQNNSSIKGLFITHEDYKIINEKLKNRKEICYFMVDYPEIEFYKLHTFLYNETCFYDKFDFKSKIGKGCHIHKSAIIEKGVIIKDNVTIGANSVINKGTIIYENTKIGSCSVIGSEGFQLIYDNNKVPFTIIHVGGTFIGKNVIINDNCTISNALFEGNVIIEDNCKIDSQVHIGHNCKIGRNTVITGNSLLMGSVELKENVWIAPSTTISNKCIVNKNSFVGAMSLVSNSVIESSRVCGIPAIPIEEYIRLIVQQKKLAKYGRKNSADNKSNKIK